MVRARERDVSGPAWAPPGAPWCAESRRCKPGPGWPGRRGPAPGGHTADRRPGSPVAPALCPSARETFRFPVGCRRSRPRAQCRQCSPASCWLATLHRHGDAPREAPLRRPHGRRVPAARPGSAASWAVILCALGSLRGDGLGPRLVHVTHVPSHHGSADSGDRAGSRSQALASGHAPSGRPVLVVAVSVCGPPRSWGQSGRPGRAAQASAPEFAERQAWTEFAATLEEAQAGGEGCPSCLRRSVPGLELGAWPATTAAAGSPSWGPAGLQGHRAMASFWAAGPACARGWAEAASRPSSSRSSLTPPPRQHPAQGHSLPPRDCRRDGGAGLCAALEALGNSSPGSVERQPRGGRPPPVPSSVGAS